jgi:hypothetical protein
MAEYIEQFRKVEIQIYDMAYTDRVEAFTLHLPPSLALYLKDSDKGKEDMEEVYRQSRE